MTLITAPAPYTSESQLGRSTSRSCTASARAPSRLDGNSLSVPITQVTLYAAVAAVAGVLAAAGPE